MKTASSSAIAWEFHDDERRTLENRKVLANYQKLQIEFNSILEAAHKDEERSRDGITNRLSALKDNITGIGEYLSLQLEPKYYNEIRPEGSLVAEQVFDIPELLENILLEWNTISIMEMEQTCKGIRETIRGSSRLQMKLGFIPQENPEPDATGKRSYSPFSTNWSPCQTGFEIAILDRLIVAEFNAESCALPKVGSRWKQMLICQPLIRIMSVKAQCFECLSTNYGYTGPSEIASNSLLTVGDLYEVASRVVEEAEECRRCGSQRGGKYCRTRFFYSFSDGS